MSINEGSWFGTCANMDRTTAMLSACSAVREKISLISRPDWPCLWNLNGEGKAVPVLRSVRSVSGKGWPACLARAGLGSNVSTWEGPPLQKKWMTRLAFAAKWGSLGARGLVGSAARVAWSARRVERPRRPRPEPALVNNSRRVRDMADGRGKVVFKLETAEDRGAAGLTRRHRDAEAQ